LPILDTSEPIEPLEENVEFASPTPYTPEPVLFDPPTKKLKP
jgi:hypothetical protein